MILERKPVFHRLSRRGFAVLAMAALAFAPAWSWGQSRREVQVVDGRIVLVPPSPNPEPTRPPAATADQEPAVIAARHDVERAKIRLEIADGEVRKAEAERDMKMSKSNRAKNLVSRLPDAVSPDELKGYEAEARAADADVDIKTKERKALALDLEIAEAAISKAIQEWKARVESEKTRQERYREAERIRKQMEPALNEQEKALREARKADEERIAQEFTPEVYRAKVGDQLAIEVLEALPGRPILGERPVRPDGTISLGWYGEVRVIGLTRRQIKEKVIARLRKFINDEALGLLAESLEHPGELIPVAPANSDRVFVEERYDRQAPAPNAQNLPPWRGADADANANAKGKPVSRLPATNVNMIAADDSPKSALTWEALNAEADFSFAEAKLEDLLEMIQQKSQSPQMPEGVIYYLDRIALEEGEFDREKTTFRLNLPKVSLKMGLGLALREMGLTFCIKSGVLVITSAAHVGDFVNHQFSSFPMTQVRPGFDANGAPTSGMNGGGKF